MVENFGRQKIVALLHFALLIEFELSTDSNIVLQAVSEYGVLVQGLRLLGKICSRLHCTLFLLVYPDVAFCDSHCTLAVQ